MALNDIVAYKKARMREKIDDIRALTERVTKTSKSLSEALKQDRASFICEIKPASPSKGIIRQSTDVLQIAGAYAPFVDAISVLADEKFFGGSLANVQKVAQAYRCPVLAKDVVVSPLQIIEARHYGADAVLLMLSVLDDQAYVTCRNTASELKMDVITEVHSEEEMHRANLLGATIIGINNRNLQTLHVDLSTCERLAPLARKNALVIAESGFSERAQLFKLSNLVHGFLIGTSLMKADRVDLALRALIFGRVKICGLTNREDARLAYEQGAYFGGLNFSETSKRQITVDDAKIIMMGAPLVWGGVFVNQSVEEVSFVAKALQLQFVQIHGDEHEDYLRELRMNLLPGVEIWRAVRIKDRTSLLTQTGADRVVLDSYSANAYGGTGQAFDWQILKSGEAKDVILAGGINLSNIAVADGLGAYALDIASGVENNDPRKKSPEKLRELFQKLRPRGAA